MKNFVARTTSSRRPSRASPTISSDAPAEYTSAVSMTLIPASRARWMIRIESARSSLPQGPNIIAPRHRELTCTPVRPSGRNCMRDSFIRVRPACAVLAVGDVMAALGLRAGLLIGGGGPDGRGGPEVVPGRAVAPPPALGIKAAPP